MTRSPSSDVPGRAPQTVVRAVMTAVVWGALALYVIPLFFPPPTTTRAPGLQARQMSRLFPGVPAWWVLGRLLCLCVGAVLAERLTRPRVGEADLLADAPMASAPQPIPVVYVGIALTLAALQLLSGLWATHFNGTAQLVYIAAFLLPAAVLAVGRVAARGRLPYRVAWRGAGAVAAVVVAWLAIGVRNDMHSPRMATVVDTWLGFNYLSATGAPGFNVLTQGFLPGVTALHMTLQGAGWFGEGGIPLRMEWVQAFHFGWLAFAGAVVGWLAATLVALPAAPVAAAAVLFSPFVLLLPLQSSAFVIGPLFGAVLLALLLRVRTHASLAALAALGAVAGVAATHPSSVPVALLMVGLAARSAVRWPALPRLALLIALLSFLAGVVPGLRQLESLAQMRERYVTRTGDWAGLEAMLLGQRSPKDVTEVWEEGRRGALDISLGTLAAPFAIPRTSLRLWGDVLFDPLGAACAAIGIAVCARRLRTHWTARVLLLMLAAGIVPGFVSSFDRASLTRLFVAPIPLAVCAALGFEVLRRGVLPGRPWAAAVLWTASIAAGGLYLFDVVNPRILAASSVSLALEAVGSRSPDGAALLEHPPYDPRGRDWLQVRTMATAVPSQPWPVITYRGPGDLQAAASQTRLFFWSPGLEGDAQVSTGLCGLWPHAALYTLTDRAGFSRALAADARGTGWRPALPETQWSVRQCSDPKAPSTF